VALLHALYQLKAELQLEIEVAHLNHMLRGQEADQDARYVGELCASLAVPCHQLQADVLEFARVRHQSIEEAARNVRYREFAELLYSQNIPLLLVAHNANDQAETVLMRLLRGTGLHGLAGMLPLAQLPDTLYNPEDSQKWLLGRPLLEVWRTEIEEYCAANKLQPRHDSSNTDLNYTRNRVRHELLPLLEEKYQHGAAVNLARLARLAGDEEAWLSELTVQEYQEIAVEIDDDENPGFVQTSYEEWVEAVTSESNQNGSWSPDNKIIWDFEGRYIVLNLTRLQEKPIALQRRLVRYAYYCFAATIHKLENLHLELILANLNKPGWKISLPNGVRAQIYPNDMVVGWGSDTGFREKNKLAEEIPLYIPETVNIKVPGVIEFSDWRIIADILAVVENLVNVVPNFSALEFKDGIGKVWLDADKVGSEVIIRGRKRGEKFKPLGAPGQRKLQDYMLDAKIPHKLREGWPLVVRPSSGEGEAERVAWVVGYGIGDEFKVTAQTQRILRLSVESLEVD